MKSVTSFLREIYFKRVDSIGLGIFRIVYFAVLICEILQLSYFSELVFYESDLDFKFLIGTWLVVASLALLGLFSRYIYLINYLFTFFIIGTINTFEYHMFYTYLGVNFLMIFIDTSKSLSIDTYLKRRKGMEVNEETSKLFYLFFLFVGVGIVYFDSIFFKLTSRIWLSGLGMWLPASLPQLVISNNSWFLNQELVVKFLGYLTILFELVFIFLLPFRKFWSILFVIGVGLHLGILGLFPIPWFALGVTSLYLLFIPNSFWRRFVKRKSLSDSKECEKPQSLQFSLMREMKDFPFECYFRSFIIIIFLQLNVIFSTSLLLPLGKKLSSYAPLVGKISNGVALVTKNFMGITAHGLFVDGHFRGYDKIFTVRYQGKNEETFNLPILNDSGMVDKYIYSFSWAKWTFRVVGPKISQKKLEKGIKDYVRFWLYKNQNQQNNLSQFIILMKEIQVPTQWEKDFLNKQIEIPWQNVGTIKLNDQGSLDLDLKNFGEQ